jgi:RNA polymerase sigma-70 factor, ECF subfamily
VAVTLRSLHDLSAAAGEQAAEKAPRSAALLLAERAAGGDVTATRELLRQLAPRALRTAAAVLGHNHALLEDVTQQALIAFVQALPGFRGECEPSTFISRITVRAAVLARKKLRRRGVEEEIADHASVLAAPDENADIQLVAAQRCDAVRELLETLSEEQAETIAMRFMLGWPLQQVADATGVPVNTVRSRLRLAREALRKRIDANPRLMDLLAPETSGETGGETSNETEQANSEEAH